MTKQEIKEVLILLELALVETCRCKCKVLDDKNKEICLGDIMINKISEATNLLVKHLENK